MGSGLGLASALAVEEAGFLLLVSAAVFLAVVVLGAGCAVSVSSSPSLFLLPPAPLLAVVVAVLVSVPSDFPDFASLSFFFHSFFH